MVFSSWVMQVNAFPQDLVQMGIEQFHRHMQGWDFVFNFVA
jgi:hypothetical protein